MRFTSLVVLATSLFSVAHAVSQTGPAAAVASPDGLIVPFTSTLPACGSLCGHLFDVQGACTPPHLTSIDKNCFCTDPRLTPLLQGGSAFDTACGTQSCQDSADQQKIESWYAGYCNKQLAQPSSTTSAPTSTPTKSGNGSNTPQNKSWIAGHYGWVIFAVVVTIAIVAGWVTASYFRRRYLRNKEKEIEMRRPVSWGPHQMQAMTGGFANSEVALGGAGRATPVTETRAMGGDASAFVEPAKRESRGWLTKERR